MENFVITGLEATVNLLCLFTDQCDVTRKLHKCTIVEIEPLNYNT